jgi:Domain of unknown function (DUF4411)
MTAAVVRYSIDTSALIHGWVRAYPPDVMPALWDRLDRLIADGRLLASKEVLLELEKKADDLHNWCKERDAMFVEIDDAIQIHMATVMGTYPKLVDTAKGKSGADPFVVALAMAHNPTLTVVTEEKGGSAGSPKIPYVCQQEDIRFISLLQFIREEGWTFR